MTALHIGTTPAGEPFTLPLEAQTVAFAIVGRRGSGKTNLAVVMVEEMVAAGLAVCILDVLGVWWGLRSSADGEGEGLPVTILGGSHGDLPIEPASGPLIANYIVENPGAYVVDLSAFASKAEEDRFAADFAHQLYRRKATNNAALHLVIDEADNFAPQNPQPGQQKMLGAFNDISRRGRVRGLSPTLITQRPAALNKNVLSQSEVLIAMQITAPQDRAALKEWVRVNGDASKTDEFLNSLAQLHVGQGWLWSPSWLDTFERIAVRPRRTFDSSATPKAGETRVEPRVLAPVDLETLREAMAATIEKAAADDPKALRARIAALEKALAKPAQNIPEIIQPCDHEALIDSLTAAMENQGETIMTLREERNDLLKRIERAAEALGWPEGIELEGSHGQRMGGDLVATIGRGETANGRLPRARESSRLEESNSLRSTTRRPDAARQSRDVEPSAVQSMSLTGLKAGARRILNELASRYPARWTRPQIGTLTSFAHKGGTFTTYLGELKRRGLVTEENGELAATDLALEALGGKPPAPTSHDEAMAIWEKALKAGAVRMLQHIVSHGETGCTRDHLSAAVDIAQSGGTFGTYLGTLRRNGLVTESGGVIVATDVLFPEGE